MTRLKTLLALAVLLVPSISLADTITINGTNGTWSGAVPAGSVINNGTTPRTLWWGTGAAQSGYNYAPAFTPFDATVDGLAFLLGTFTHRNYPIGEPWLTSVNLDFNLDWDSFAPDLAGAFTFSHHETPNAANPCAYGGAHGQGINAAGCADRVLISSPFLNTLINDGVVTYYFSSVGFSTDGGATANHQYFTREGQMNTAGLYGRLTSVPIPDPTIPEPAILLLLGSGLVGLGYRLRRNVIVVAALLVVPAVATGQVGLEIVETTSGPSTGIGGLNTTAIAQDDVDGEVRALGAVSLIAGTTKVTNEGVTGVNSLIQLSDTSEAVGASIVYTALYARDRSKLGVGYGSYMLFGRDAGATIGDLYGNWVQNMQGLVTTPGHTAYPFWYDGGVGSDCNSGAVFRVNDIGSLAIYNPCFAKYTAGAPDHERIIQRWGDTGVFGVDNVAYIGVEPGGTGANRHLQLIGGGLSFSSTLVTPARTGTRFLCISTTGVVRSSTTACKGT